MNQITGNDFRYQVLAIATCFIWGLAFFFPYALSDINPAAFMFGRYIFYGLTSILIVLFSAKVLTGTHLSRRDWLIAFVLAFCGNTGYYLMLSIGIRYSGMSLSALIIGILPITVIMFGSIGRIKLIMRNLSLQLFLIAAGLIIINSYKIQIDWVDENNEMLLGVLFNFIALFLWTIYGIYNGSYLKKRPHIYNNQWNVAVGICTFAQSLIGIFIYFFVLNKSFFTGSSLEVNIEKNILLFLLSCLMLGVLVSWLATLMWNSASRNLEPTLIGQLIVFETIAVILYEHIWDWKLPSLIDVFSFILILTGVFWGIWKTNSIEQQLKSS